MVLAPLGCLSLPSPPWSITKKTPRLQVPAGSLMPLIGLVIVLGLPGWRHFQPSFLKKIYFRGGGYIVTFHLHTVAFPWNSVRFGDLWKPLFNLQHVKDRSTSTQTNIFPFLGLLSIKALYFWTPQWTWAGCGGLDRRLAARVLIASAEINDTQHLKRM